MSSHSPKYEKVRQYYLEGLWTAQMVQNAVTAPYPWITAEEAEEILASK